MRLSILHRALTGCAGLVLLLPGSAAMAQAPPPVYPPPPAFIVPAAPASPEAAEIAACLCLQQSMNVLGADMAARQRSYDEVRAELTRLDAQLERERASVEVNNPQSVARFRQLLQQRDGVFRRSTGPVATELSSAVERYNGRVNEYNARCADRPRDPVLLGRVQATLACPGP
jgi:hypothetical protein